MEKPTKVVENAQADQLYGSILADPPWRFMNRTGKSAPEHRRLHRYETMTTDEIARRAVGRLAASQSHLYLWVPMALIEDGLRVMRAWGFTYKTSVLWLKTRKDGEPDLRCMGFYFRVVTEVLLFGVRGGLRTGAPARRLPNLIRATKREHSRKPDEAYDLIELVSPGPYVELFARPPHRIGWDTWGDQSDVQAVHLFNHDGPLEKVG